MTQLLKYTFLLLLFSFLSATGFAQNNHEWIFKNEKDDVKVFYRKTSDVHEIKLTTSIKSNLSGLVHLLSEVEVYPEWGYKVVETKLLRKISDTEIIYYSRLDFPWPMADRDFVMHSKVYQDPQTKVILAESVAMPDYIPEKKDILRIRNTKTSWKIWPGTSGWAYVEYYIYSDPGGKLPDWLVNAAIDMGPRETIKRMRVLLKKPEYQAVRLAHILD